MKGPDKEPFFSINFVLLESVRLSVTLLIIAKGSDRDWVSQTSEVRVVVVWD